MSQNIKVTPDQFADALVKALGEYGEKVIDIAEAAEKNAARQARAELKASAPAGGSYARGWSNRAQNSGAWGKSQVVFNRTDYQLIHLLEKPHPTGGGGHYPKNVDYTGTVARVEEKYKNMYMEEVLRKL